MVNVYDAGSDDGSHFIVMELVHGRTLEDLLDEQASNTRKRPTRIPAGPWGTPQALAGVTVFPASPASAYVHGTLIPVGGGWLGR